MAQTDHLCIVFRIQGIGFVMPVVDLLTIQELSTVDFRTDEDAGAAGIIGRFRYRDTDVPVYDLAKRLQLAPSGQGYESLLVFSGAELPWGLTVDRVEGVVDVCDFVHRDLPSFLFRPGDMFYTRVALRDDEPYVSCQAWDVERAWTGGR